MGPEESLIRTAIEDGDIDSVVRILKENPDSVNMPGDDGLCPIHQAATHNRVELLRLLIGWGADVNSDAQGFGTPLHFACRNNHCEVVTVLFEHGANPNSKAALMDNSTPLHFATEIVDSTIATVLVESGADLEALDCRNDRPLHLAASHNNVILLGLLLDRGAEINARGRFSQTALHRAIEDSCTEAAHLLITRGADLNARDIDDYTPLNLALMLKSDHDTAKVADSLLQQGALIDLFAAVQLGRAETVRQLLIANPSHIIEDPHAKDLLSVAVSNENEELAILLIAYGADVNAVGRESPPLWAALQILNPECARRFLRLLLNHGADPNLVQTPNAPSPLDWVRSHRKDIIDVFTSS